jgi:hypothetical protein
MVNTKSAEDLIREREALEEMLRSEGWAVFVARVTDEWAGQGYFSRMGAALASDDSVAPKVVHRTSIEMQRMLQWPKDRLQHLAKGKHE